MHLFGEKAGIAFQIKDDLFDYTENSFLGKPTGIDIKEKKITLPLIYTINSADRKLKNWIINVLKNHSEDNKKVNQLISIVTKNGGVAYAEQKMHEYHDEALNILKCFKDNEAKKSLILLLDYVINRKK